MEEPHTEGMILLHQGIAGPSLKAIAKLHTEAFPGFFLTTLGEAFLTELYKAFAQREHGILVTAIRGGNILGFAAGTTHPALFFRQLRRDRFAYFALISIPALFRNPAITIQKLARAVRYKGDEPKAVVGAALLSSIAVSPLHQNLGLGARLMHRFESEVLASGTKCVYLTTDAGPDNQAARFYARNGYKVDGVFNQTSTRRMVRYLKQLAP